MRTRGFFFSAKKLSIQEEFCVYDERATGSHPRKALEAIGGTESAEDLDALRVQYLGKKGELTAVLKQMGKSQRGGAPGHRPDCQRGPRQAEERPWRRAQELAAKALEMKLKAEAVDVTIPGKAVKIGKKHPMYHRARRDQAGHLPRHGL